MWTSASVRVRATVVGIVLSSVASAQVRAGDDERGLPSAPAAGAVQVSPPPLSAAPSVAGASLPPAATTAQVPASAEIDPAVAEAERQAAEEERERAREAQHLELTDLARDFEREAREYRNDVQFLIERTYDERRATLNAQFERAIREVEVSERQERLNAIARFERFVARYPDEPRYTPDAMTRLAELYYEKAVDDQQVALNEFEEQLKLGAGDAAPPETVRSFAKSIALYQQIIEKFPDYRLIDSIYYLLGWCLAEEGEEETSLAWFQELINRFPSSRYVPEAWVRIGEYHFDYQGDDVDDKLLLAVQAYTQAVQFKDSPLYDKALYKLGWSFYRLNNFDDSVNAFVSLIDHYDALKKEDPEAGGDLRAEALQYTAISFADDNWGGTSLQENPDGTVTEHFQGVQKLERYLNGIGGRPYEWELFRKLGDVLFDSSKNLAAVDAYRKVLERQPLAADAPKIQERIVQAFARERRLDEAFAEREKLVDTYGENSPWAKANAGDQDVLVATRELVERNLLSTAQYHHAQAFEFEKCLTDEARAPSEQEVCGVRMLDAYRKAAKAYGGYLTEFPHSKNLYEIQYFHAETLYNSLQFAQAAEEYARVRDSNTDNKYLANAAYYVVLALQKEIESQERNALIETRNPCDPESCAGITDFTPQPMPDIRLKLIAAADIYMQKIPSAEDAAVLSFKAAQTYFSYFHFDEARRRYDEVIRRFGQTEYAEFAFNDILISYLLAQDWENVEKFADRMLKESKATQDDPTKREEKRLLKYGARFKRANLLMEQKKWQDAADLYLSIVDDTEKEAKSPADYWENADKALYNAATCYKEFRRFDSAMRTYERLFNNYPKSELAQSALFFVAEAAEKAFEFEKAIEYYQRLVTNYKDSTDRVAAAYNVAALLEAIQRYKDAAEAYRFYARTFPAEADAPDMAYKAANIYQRMGDTQGLIKALTDFVATYKNTETQYEKIVQSYLKIGLAWAKLDNERLAQSHYDSAVKYFDQKGLKPDDYLGAQAAGEARFRQVEASYEKFRAKKFDPKGRGTRFQKAMTDQLEGLAKDLEALRVDYEGVIVKYRWPEWITASLLRLGNINEQFGRKLLDAPCPAEIASEFGEEGCFEYKIQLEELISPIMDKAILAYETAVEKATELRIVNEWTKLAMEKVCEYSPTKCKSLKEPRTSLIIEGHSPLPLMGPDGVTPAVMPEAATPAITIIDVQPRSAPAGATLEISGAGFGADTSAVAVSVGAMQVAVLEISDTRLVVQLPEAAVKGAVTVSASSGQTVTPFEVESIVAPQGIGAPAGVLPAPSPEPAPVEGGLP